MAKFSTVIIANRLPISVSKVDGVLQFHRSSGGLPTAMSSLASSDTVWVGWPGIAKDDLTPEDEAKITRELKKSACIPVFLTEKQVHLFYEGYANDTLWPLFHYFQSHVVYKDEYWCAYKGVNALYAEVSASVATADATIWIHDYHLMLLPKLLRSTLPDSSIGFFLHVPFPSFEIFRLLPERRDILEGLLSADLVGFHIYDYARHFISSCLRLLGVPSHHGTLHYNGRLIRVDAFPIGIDYEKFVAMRRDTEVLAARKALKKSYTGQKIILSVDRLDYSKGIPERLEAYRQLLEHHPEYHGRVKLVMVAVPSRTDVETYRHLRDEIEQTVSRINGTYGTTKWAPISYQFQNLPFTEVCALYAEADVMLVTPIRDGMNLVAKEYVASKSDAPGVLILSEMTGAIDELPESLGVNPNDAKSIECAIITALQMSTKEQQERLDAMQARLHDYPVTVWSADFLDTLKMVRKQQTTESYLNIGVTEVDAIKTAYTAAEKRLIILDYDGTLQTFKSSPAPSAAKPSKHLLGILAALTNDAQTTVCIVTGRKKEALDQWFPDTKMNLTAEHGAWKKRDDAWQRQDFDFEPIREIITPIVEDYTSKTPGARVEQKDFAVVWHYRNVPIELAYVRAANLRHDLELALEGQEVVVHSGSKIVEIKPKFANKGIVANELISDYSPDFCLVAGDDYTDEDMFEIAPKFAYTIKVGNGMTKARYRIASVEEMVDLLQKLSA